MEVFWVYSGPAQEGGINECHGFREETVLYRSTYKFMLEK